MKTIGAKVIFAYFFLTFLNISFFTIFIFENQVDLITEVTKYETREAADAIYSRIVPLIEETMGGEEQNEGYFERLSSRIERMQFISSYIFYTEGGELLDNRGGAVDISEKDLENAVKALANRDILGRSYFSEVDTKNYQVTFYAPVSILGRGDTVFRFSLDMKNVDKRLAVLYRFVVVIIIISSLIHMLFGFVLHRMIVQPITNLAATSLEISRGELSARVNIRRKDEIGRLGNAFNDMAQSVQQTVIRLNEQNAIMVQELQMARQVQERIYPKPGEGPGYSMAVYHRPLIGASGDYHDIFSLGKTKTGFLVADISGHGVGAALMSVLIKDSFEEGAPQFSDSADLLRYVNSRLKHLMEDYNRYFTALYVILGDGYICYSSAAHNPGFHVDGETGVVTELTTPGFYLGIMEEMNSAYCSGVMKVKIGDRLLLFSDGIIEARNLKKEIFGEQRFKELVIKYYQQPCRQMLESLSAAYEAFIGEANHLDDATLMIVEVKQRP